MHKVTENKHNFLEIFSDIKEYLSESDYVVGNLETPIAGSDLGYSNKKVNFNTPEEFLGG